MHEYIHVECFVQATFGDVEDVDGLVNIKFGPERLADFRTCDDGFIQREEEKQPREMPFPCVDGGAIEQDKAGTQGINFQLEFAVFTLYAVEVIAQKCGIF